MTVANPWLSVVMPVLNGANYLAQALQSVACQADDEMELIVVDGGSTDGTTEILDSFASRLPLRLFQCDHLKGWVKTTNFGLSQAIGDMSASFIKTISGSMAEHRFPRTDRASRRRNDVPPSRMVH